MYHEKRKAQGQEHVRRAEKAVKTGLLKWMPDYDKAADEFYKASTAFKIGQDYPKALESAEKACECYKQIKALYHVRIFNIYKMPHTINCLFMSEDLRICTKILFYTFSLTPMISS